MNEPRTLRRPAMHFDAGVGPSHVTFDDGQLLRRNLPWGDFVQARWQYAEPGLIQVEIGAWMVEIRGHNLDPLFAAIEEQTLLRVRAHPELDALPDHEPDTFATEIRFLEPQVAAPRPRHGQLEIDLDG